MEELIDRKKDITDVKLMPPLVWAYVGDSVYELFIRTYLVNNSKMNPHKLHVEAIKYVKAKAQAEILENLQKFLTDEEKDIVRRGRNAENHHIAKNANVADYAQSTAFEALIGYLYLSKNHTRLKEILNLCID